MWQSAPTGRVARATLGPVDGRSGLHLELQFADVHRAASAWRLGGIHRAERVAADFHVLSSVKVLLDHGRSLVLVNKDPDASRGDPLRRSVGLLDAREQLLQPLGVHPSEPDNANVHDTPPRLANRPQLSTLPLPPVAVRLFRSITAASGAVAVALS